MPRDHRGRIHIFEDRPAMIVNSARYGFEAGRLRDRIGTGMRLEVADDYVDALHLELLRLGQHLIGLADPGRIAQKYL